MVLAMITVPFASDDPRPWTQNYKFNVLEVTDAEAARRFFEVVATPNGPTTPRDAALLSQYCREGVETGVNAREAVYQTLSPAAQRSLDEMERVFRAAGGDQDGKAHLGWKALLAGGHIDQDQFDALESTGAVHVPFRIGRRDLEPISTYKPQGIERAAVPGQGLSARPLHIGELVGGILEVNFNRQRTSQAISADLSAALASASSPQEAGQLLGGAAAVAGHDPQTIPALVADPTKHAGIVDGFGKAMHAQLVGGVLAHPEIRKTIQQSIGYAHMDAPSQAKVDDLLQRYEALARSAPTLSDAQLRRARRTLDARAAATTITYGPPIDRTDRLMVFVPPQYDVFAGLGTAGTSKPGYQPIADLLPSHFQVGATGVSGEV